MVPIREIPMKELEKFNKKNLRPVKYGDFEEIIKKTKPLLTK